MEEAPGRLTAEAKAALLEAIVQSSEDAIITKDLEGRITSWNAAAMRLFGYAENEIVGQSILKLVPERLHDEEREILSRVRSGERISHYETTRMAKGGREIPISLTISPLRDQDGRVFGVSKIARDIGERNAAQYLRLRMAAIVESSDDAILSKDLNGTIMSWNRGAERIFGYTEEEMKGQSILKLIPEEMHGEETMILEKLRRGERIEHFETERLKRNGERLQVSLTISPVKDEAGKIIGVSKILRDITDRKAMEKTLMQTEKFAATEKMAATIAHEINNPLEGLVNLIYLAKDSLGEPELALEYLTGAEEELARVAQIAKQSLGYFRDREGARQSALEELLREALKTYQPKLIAANVVVETEFGDVPAISVKRGEMLQVISNMLMNSMHAMPAGGMLRIRTRMGRMDSKEAVVVTVEDTGIGIAAENLGRIFEPFYTTRATVGTGSGLWVSKRFVEGHGGRIEVESWTGDRSGTKFSIVLPVEKTDSPS
jgi:PAS domain S-box-containing protein